MFRVSTRARILDKQMQDKHDARRKEELQTLAEWIEDVTETLKKDREKKDDENEEDIKDDNSDTGSEYEKDKKLILLDVIVHVVISSFV